MKICFIHIPKTGGKSVISLLQRWYPDATMPPAHDWAMMHPETLARVVAGEYEITCGHFRLFDINIEAHPGCKFITVLRDPIEQVISSFYEHYRARKTCSPEHRRLLESGLENVILSGRIREFVWRAVDMLSSCHEDDGLEAMMESAKWNLARFELVGFFDRFTEFAEMFGELTCQVAQPIPHENRNPLKPDDIDLSKAAWDRLFLETKPDTELYRFAKNSLKYEYI